MNQTPPAKVARTPYPLSFWAVNSAELFERMAWYGMFNFLSVYLVASTMEGGLGLTHLQRGTIQGIVPFILYTLPIFAGAMADRFGYRKTLLIAFTIMAPAYWLMGQVHGYGSFFAAFTLMVVGAAAFKPVIPGTISRVTDPTNSTVGFSIYYQVVNIGGLIGPLLAAYLYKIRWEYLFGMSAVCILINYLPILLLYKEPVQKREKKPLAEVAKGMFLVVGNWRFMLFLIIFSGFWAGWEQLFYSLPLYIEQHVDTSNLVAALRTLFSGVGLSSIWPTVSGVIEKNGQFDAGVLINFDSLLVIAFVVLVSRLVSHIPAVKTMAFGISIGAIGPLFLCFFHSSGAVLVYITFLAFGEMVATPKFFEYVGSIAPAENKALFQGYAFLAIALGMPVAGFLSGYLYGHFAEKTLANPRPEMMWVAFAALGFATAAALFVYNLFLAPKSAAEG
jgi:proton-dependent oligopeptide transporter, POT family